MNDLAETIRIERDGLRDMLEAVAVDARTTRRRIGIRLIVSTLHEVDNAVMLDVAMVNEASAAWRQS